MNLRKSAYITPIIMKKSMVRSALKERMAKTRDELPQGLMREVLETYKPNLLTRRRRYTIVISSVLEAKI